MINTDVDHTDDLCPICKELDEKLSTSQFGDARVLSVPKDSFHQDFVSGKTLSNHFHADKLVLESYRSNHVFAEAGGRTCTVQPVKMKTPLRIIDCSALQVRELMPGESYVRLSYFWGNVAPAKVSLGSQIDPGTIASMHLIYGGAEVTIAAASGIDALHGLPGVLTFQEAVLPVHLLVFTDRQIYFQCYKAHHLEHYKSEDPLSRQRIFLFTRTDLEPLATFTLLTEYFPKELPFAKDRSGLVDFASERGYWSGRTLAPDVSGLPSWTWASQKSTYRSFITARDFFDLDASWSNFRELRYHITHRDGKTIDVFEFVTSSLPEHYSNFFPWIDITSWTVRSQITTPDLKYSNKTLFGGMRNSGFKFDEGVPQNDEAITAVFIGTGEAWSHSVDSEGGLVFFLVRPTTQNTFSRVGIWYLYEESKLLSLEQVMADPEPTLLERFTEDPQKYLEFCGLRYGAVVEKKTLRLV
ncbi:hypothetical protein COCMIDRAFT_41891 [Bipolaris oryzae ATCC 44560]|uniref:Heterokaryon incompatibility domain-containing protein n=1 Tax=Bipolaris oryzae ATCC 44560 TaxID=930090 RepID=W6Z7E3_COCMI|nr:uncharacterized protein COCMIDRAFT_41891 [Bipolaris oryzae ATCC 44560]EUC39616.1 hypothetical protein COCMIDRAFT_41891 [Bipolaris oryzae ATCC 44560]